LVRTQANGIVRLKEKSKPPKVEKDVPVEQVKGRKIKPSRIGK